MSDDIITNPVVLAELARELAMDLKMIKDINDNMDSELKTLGSTFQDEDYDKVKGSVSAIQSLINEAFPQVTTVSNKLITQAELIQKQMAEMNE